VVFLGTKGYHVSRGMAGGGAFQPVWEAGRAWHGGPNTGGKTAGATAPVLVEIDVTHGRRGVGVFLDALEKLVEFLLEHLAVRLLRFDLLAEDFVAPRLFAFQLDDFGRQVVNQLGPLGKGVGNDGARFGIDSESRLAAGALHVEHAFGHGTIVRDSAGLELAPGSEKRRL